MKNQESKEELLVLANAGDLDSQYRLAWCYEHEEDYEKAFYWFNECADKGFVCGINAVATYYCHGMHVQKDSKKAFELYSRIMNELPSAKFNVGTMLLEGEGCQKDIKKGLQLYKETANEGDGIAALMLGRIYLDGLYSTVINYRKAIKWFEKAYHLGEYESVMYLCDIYAGLYSISMKDKKKHKQWLDIECELSEKGVFKDIQHKMPIVPSDKRNGSYDTLQWLQEKSGRYYMYLDGLLVYRDEILARTFLVNPDSSRYTAVEHIDGDLSNDNLNNLRWVIK